VEKDLQLQGIKFASLELSLQKTLRRCPSLLLLGMNSDSDGFQQTFLEASQPVKNSAVFRIDPKMGHKNSFQILR
jgi:hypothetical protein